MLAERKHDFGWFLIWVQVAPGRFKRAHFSLGRNHTVLSRCASGAWPESRPGMKRDVFLSCGGGEELLRNISTESFHLSKMTGVKTAKPSFRPWYVICNSTSMSHCGTEKDSGEDPVLGVRREKRRKWSKQVTKGHLKGPSSYWPYSWCPEKGIWSCPLRRSEGRPRRLAVPPVSESSMTPSPMSPRRIGHLSKYMAVHASDNGRTKFKATAGLFTGIMID